MTFVEKFLDFLDHVSDLGLDFNWDHAEDAEPKELSIKVKEKMEGKNLFIGICTARQKSIAVDRVKSFPLNKKMSWGSEIDFTIKTSDWILQEIGFAFGRAMKIMILLEDGVARPGGIQGDIEYIPFDRESPERSFNKILEMLRSLIVISASPKVSEKTEKAGSEKSPQQDESISAEKSKDEKHISEWSLEDYELEQYFSIVGKDNAKEKEVHESFLNSPFASDKNNLAVWNARRLHLKMDFGKENHLDELLGLLSENPENSDVLYHVAQSYELYGEHERAASYYQKSSSFADKSEDKIIRLSMASLAFAKLGEKKKSSALNKQCVSMVRELGKGTGFMYRSLADISRELGNTDEYKVFTEAYLELSPEDHYRRFSLAYKYSEDGEDDSAMFHYSVLVERNPDKSNWNNYGVALTRLKIPSLSIRAYREAEKLGETLAMSNLADKFVAEGFLDEAMDLVNKATSYKDYNENIGSTIASIKTMKGKDEKERSKLIEKFKKLRQFYIDYSKAYLKEELQSISSDWQGSKCKFQITLQDGNFTAKGSYDKPKQPAYAWSSTSGQKDETIMEYITYRGTLNGYSIKYKCWISKDELTDTNNIDPNSTGIMIVDDEAELIRIYEMGLKNREEGFSEMTQIKKVSDSDEQSPTLKM